FLTQRLALNVLHGDEGLPVRLADFVDGQNVGMIEGGGSSSLLKKPTPPVLVSMRIGADHLEGNQAVELLVVLLVHPAHPGSAKRLQDSVVGDPRSLGDSFHIRAASPDKAGKKDRMPRPIRYITNCSSFQKDTRSRSP